MTKPNDVAIQALIDDTKNNIQFLLVRSDNPEIQIANAGLLFAVIAKAPRSWWWQGGQSTTVCFVESRVVAQSMLDNKSMGSHEVLQHQAASIDISLCESGRFLVWYCDAAGSDFVLLDASRAGKPLENFQKEFSRDGGNRTDILPPAAVPWEEAWRAVAEFIITGGRLPTESNWHSRDAIEGQYGREVLEA